MNDIRDILRTALPDNRPPSSITSQTAIAAGHRLRRRRRAGGAAVAAGLTVVLTVGGVTGLQSLVLRPTPFQVGVSTSASDSPPPTRPTPTGSTAPTSLVDIAPSVTRALLAATREVAPNVSVSSVAHVFADADLAPYQTVKSQGGIKAWSLLRDAHGPGTLFINLSPGGDVHQQATCLPQQPGNTCITKILPNGEPVTIEEGAISSTARYLAVGVVQGNGTQAYAQLVNYSENDQPATKGSQPYGQRSTQILTSDELVRILLSPGVTIPPGLNLGP